MRSSHYISLSVLLVLGCGPELPPLEYRSLRARVGSDIVDQVCAGTLARIDREFERIEARLELPPTGDIAEIYIVDPEVSMAHCNEFDNCLDLPSKRVIINRKSFENVIAHELAHYRSALVTDLRRAPSLFREGLAVALAPASCPAHFSADLGANELLELRSGLELKRKGGYYLGGELFAWLLDAHDPLEVISLFRLVERRDPAGETQSNYQSLFHTDLDDDLFGHLRDPAKLAPEDFGCFGPETPVFAQFSSTAKQYLLHAEMDCNSPDVQNNFLVPDAGYVEWIVVIDEAQAGFYTVVGDVPEWTVLTIEPCGCLQSPSQKRDHLKPRTFERPQKLEAGGYRLRWTARLDSGAVLDAALIRQ